MSIDQSDDAPPAEQPRLRASANEGAIRIEVWEDHEARWLEFGDAVIQSKMNHAAPERLALPYLRSMASALLFEPCPRRCLILGLGGGALVRFLRKQCRRVALDAIEVSPAVAELAARHFGIRPGDDLTVTVADCREALATPRPPADIAFLDVFTSTGLPQWLHQARIYRRIRRRLAPGGVLAANLWVRDEDEFLEVIGGVREAFDGQVLLLTVPGYRNLIAFAFAGAPPVLETSVLLERARRLCEPTGIDFRAMVLDMQACNLVQDGALVL